MAACQQCKYFGMVIASAISPTPETRMVCRRYPPQVTAVLVPTERGATVVVQGYYPPMDKSEVACGEFAELGVANG